MLNSTVGQCTGLKDKNGAVIFEGDIIQHKNYGQHVGVAEWVDDRYLAKTYADDNFNNFQKSNALTDGERYWYYVASEHFDEAEIIGNIHDNPELLKGESQ